MKRRPVRFRNLQEAVVDVKQLATRGYDRAGNWSLEQNLDHLNKAMQMSIDGPKSMMFAPIRPILRWVVFSRMKRGDVVSLRVPSPKDIVPSDVKLEAALADFERLAGLIESPQGKLSPMHPAFGRFSRDDWLALHRWHTGHHLSFLLPRVG